jgi:dihydroxy-acid dehydratase
MTVTGQTVAENIQHHHYRYPPTNMVVKTMEEPFGYSGGVAVLREFWRRIPASQNRRLR